MFKEPEAGGAAVGLTLTWDGDGAEAGFMSSNWSSHRLFAWGH